MCLRSGNVFSLDRSRGNHWSVLLGHFGSLDKDHAHINQAALAATPPLSSCIMFSMLSIFLCFFFYCKCFSLICYYLIVSFLTVTSCRVIEGHVYVYQGNPYNHGPLATEHLILTEILDSSPEHMAGIIHNVVTLMDTCRI